MKRKGRFWQYAYVKGIIVVVAMIFPLNVITVVQNRQAKEILETHARMSFQSILDNYMSDLHDKMSNASEQLFQFVDKDSNLLRMRAQSEINYEYQSSKMKFYYTLQMVGGMSYGIDGYYYYMNNLDDILVFSAGGDKIRKEMEEYIPALRGEVTYNGWHMREINDTKYLLLLIEKSNLTFGGWINLNHEMEQLRNWIEYEDFDLFFSEEMPQVDVKQKLLSSSKVENIYLNLIVPQKEILKSLSWTQKVMEGMVLISFLLVPLLCYAIQKIFIRPLRVMNDAHAYLQGNPDYRIAEESNTIEYKELYLSFNQMAARLKELKIESYEKELEKRKMELRNIQIQMQPHFLLNTFNLVYNLSSRNEGKAVQQVMIYLSNYFRYILRNDKELDLFAKELKMIEEYISVMSIRYPGRLQFNASIEPEVNFVRIPPLLIHNFVENSIKHGLKAERDLHLTINGKLDGENVVFEIIDDGNGMSEEILQQQLRLINGENKVENPNQHIGLVNSMKRLKYFYGENAKIDLYSEYERMTVVSVQFPYKMGEEYEPFDCER